MMAAPAGCSPYFGLLKNQSSKNKNNLSKTTTELWSLNSKHFIKSMESNKSSKSGQNLSKIGFWNLRIFGSLALGSASTTPLLPLMMAVVWFMFPPDWPNVKVAWKNAFGGLNAPVRRLRVFLLEPVFTSTYCDNSLFLASAKEPTNERV